MRRPQFFVCHIVSANVLPSGAGNHSSDWLRLLQSPPKLHPFLYILVQDDSAESRLLY